MNCPNCGAGATQGSDGSWICNNYCGWASGFAPAPTTAVSFEHGYAPDERPGTA
ncbi:hypothetical protein ACGFZA_15850 [Streptomyces sp. NPDC048211]|uniref:hypothetical protein n=1 Tax=Streptomyces sp. NPDC048211 TaxID=3365516 RepID=UPI003713083F